VGHKYVAVRESTDHRAGRLHTIASIAAYYVLKRKLLTPTSLQSPPVTFPHALQRLLASQQVSLSTRRRFYRRIDI
jgi:hypothetical protein